MAQCTVRCGHLVIFENCFEKIREKCRLECYKLNPFIELAVHSGSPDRHRTGTGQTPDKADMDREWQDYKHCKHNNKQCMLDAKH